MIKYGKELIDNCASRNCIESTETYSRELHERGYKFPERKVISMVLLARQDDYP